MTAEPAALFTEAVYDHQIEPLMRQIHRICTEHAISYTAGFDLAGPSETPDGKPKRLIASSGHIDEDHVGQTIYLAALLLRDGLDGMRRDPVGVLLLLGALTPASEDAPPPHDEERVP